MAQPRSGRRRWAGSAVALTLALGIGLGAVPVAPREAAAAEAPLPAWSGRVDLYRIGTFTTQKTWLWCTAAGVQIVRNIVEDDTDHSTAAQRTYFAWMRRHNRYTLPVSAGVDPAGWTAGLRHFVDDRYRLVASRSFGAALRSAVTRIRLTGLPVAITVAHGEHGWILSGFSASADPAVTKDFEVTSVRVVGPLYGLQSKNGYDMKPGTSLTTAQLKRFFTPWRYAPKAMIWDGKYVSIQPVPVAAQAATATASPSPTASPTPTASPSPTASPTSRPATATPTTSPGPVAAAVGQAPGASPDVAALAEPAGDDDTGLMLLALATFLGVVGLVVVGLIRWRRPTPRDPG